MYGVGTKQVGIMENQTERNMEYEMEKLSLSSGHVGLLQFYTASKRTAHY